MKFEYHDIPADLVATAKNGRAHGRWREPRPNERLMNKYPRRASFPEERSSPVCVRSLARDPADAVRHRVQEQGRAAHARRGHRVPALADRHSRRSRDDDEKEVVRYARDDAKFSALAFKMMTDPFVGQLTFIRVYSGVSTRRHRLNPVKGKKERIGRILQMHANDREEIKECDRRRHRRRGRSEGRHHRRHAVRPATPMILLSAWSSRSR